MVVTHSRGPNKTVQWLLYFWSMGRFIPRIRHAAAAALRRACAFFSFIHGNSITITLAAINSRRASIKKIFTHWRHSKIKTQIFYRLWLVTSAGVNKRADREGSGPWDAHTKSRVLWPAPYLGVWHTAIVVTNLMNHRGFNFQQVQGHIVPDAILINSHNPLHNVMLHFLIVCYRCYSRIY